MALTDNLVSCFECEEASGNLVDAVAGANTATVSGSPGTSVGKVGNARTFDGSTTYFTKTSPTFPSGANSITTAAWIYPTASNTDAAIVSKYRNTGNQRQFLGPYLDSNTAQAFACADGASPASVSASAFGTLNTNTWYFVCCRYDHAGGLLKISVNAGTVYTTSYSAGLFAGTAPLEIARWDGITTFTGRLDQILIYSRSISDAEVTSLYNSGAGLSYAAMGGATGTPNKLYNSSVRSQSIKRASVY